MRLAVPAFFGLAETFTDTTGQTRQCWPTIQAAASAVRIVVPDGSFPALAAGDPNAKKAAQDQFNALRSNGMLVLGYVFSRTGGGATDPLLSEAQITAAVDAWYTQFPAQLDGIYFDNAVLWPDAGGAATYPVGPGGAQWTAQSFWTDVAGQLRQSRPGINIMLLAGQCPDEWVVQVADYALMWEEAYSVYASSFYPLVNNAPAMIPPWWKNPAYLNKISHTVTGCPAANVQGVLELCRERNAGNVYMIDITGSYPRLPPYWDDVVWNVNTYADAARALSTEQQFRAAHRYGTSQGKLHAWPNGEQATYFGGQVRGTYLLDNDLQLAEWRDVPRADLAFAPNGTPGGPAPELYDIPALWRGAHYWARGNGFETAMPTFEAGVQNGVPVCGLILLRPGSWLQHVTVPRIATYEQPTFAEPGFVMRNINRVAVAQGYRAGWPTFVPDDPTWPPGRVNTYDCYFVANSATQVTWQDVPAITYLSLV